MFNNMDNDEFDYIDFIDSMKKDLANSDYLLAHSMLSRVGVFDLVTATLDQKKKAYNVLAYRAKELGINAVSGNDILTGSIELAILLLQDKVKALEPETKLV